MASECPYDGVNRKRSDSRISQTNSRKNKNNRKGYSPKSLITEAVIDQIKERQTRPLDAVYPIVYLALGVNQEARKKLLGMWIAETEGAKF